MATFVIFRPLAAQQEGITTPEEGVATPAGGSPPRRRERLRRWCLLPAGPPRPPRPPRQSRQSRQSLLEIQHAVLERVLALLEAAWADVSAGWAQDGWWATPAAGGQQLLATGLAAGACTPHRADAVCLVGALIRAGAAQGGDSEFGRAVDAVYQALWESRDQPDTIAGMLTLSSPHVRQARVQALTRWNDTQGRSSDEILSILDRAIARIMQALAGLPAPRAAAGAAAQP